MRCQLGKVAWLSSTFAQRLAPEPGHHPDHIHGHRRQELLEVCPRQSDIATLAEIKAPDALRELLSTPDRRAYWSLNSGVS